MILPVVIAVQKGRSSKKVFLSLSGKKKVAMKSKMTLFVFSRDYSHFPFCAELCEHFQLKKFVISFKKFIIQPF